MQKNTHLAADQVNQFKNQGYLVHQLIFSDAEVAAFATAYDESLDTLRTADQLSNIRPGQLGDGTQTQVHQIRCAHLAHPLFDSLIRDPRILDSVESLIGPNLKLILCQGLYKPPRTGGAIDWHQDDYYFRISKKNAVVSCWITFDSATVDSGCMWVLPGKHTQLWPHEKLESPGYRMIKADESQAVALELNAGQLMFHHGATPHRTLANTTDHPRRALAIHYMDATARTLDGNRQAEPAEHMPVVRGSTGA
jgi:phytanoyl-CoA hydroxylase